jgi:hypothetical protein
MAQMTDDQADEWMANRERQRRLERVAWNRSRFELVVNHGITPDELPKWYKLRRGK